MQWLCLLNAFGLVFFTELGRSARLSHLASKFEAFSGNEVEDEAGQWLSTDEVEHLHSERVLSGSPVWKFRGVEGPKTVSCDGREYSFLRKLDAGAMGVTLVMTRKTEDDESEEDKYVAKFLKPNATVQDLNRECEVMRRLKDSNVPNALLCVASCVVGEQQVIITTPFLEGAKDFRGQLDPDFFSDGALRPVMSTLSTARSMLAANILNLDQRHNILYTSSGETLFIDFGSAVFLDEDELKARTEDRLWQFYNDMRNKVPRELYNTPEVVEAVRRLRDEVYRIRNNVIPSNLRNNDDELGETLSALKIPKDPTKLF